MTVVRGDQDQIVSGSRQTLMPGKSQVYVMAPRKKKDSASAKVEAPMSLLYFLQPGAVG